MLCLLQWTISLHETFLFIVVWSRCASVRRTIIYAEQHVLLMWSLAFYIAEHFIHELAEMDFVSRLFQVRNLKMRQDIQ